MVKHQYENSRSRKLLTTEELKQPNALIHPFEYQKFPQSARFAAQLVLLLHIISANNLLMLRSQRGTLRLTCANAGWAAHIRVPYQIFFGNGIAGVGPVGVYINGG
jgi:hypothetical protein